MEGTGERLQKLFGTTDRLRSEELPSDSDGRQQPVGNIPPYFLGH